MPYEELLNAFVELCVKTLGEDLTGVYLHGSLALGCFHPEKSDIDLIVVTESALTMEQKWRLIDGIVELNALAPRKGLELSFVQRQFCKPFVYPTPYELHFSPAHMQLWREDPDEYLRRLQGTDKDLAAHFTIINRCGITLYGEKAARVFGSVPMGDYLDSIWYDVENAPQDVEENPMYVILNLCRALAFVREGTVMSKKEGGEWGMKRLDREYRALAQAALAEYTKAGEREYDLETARRFANDMLKMIRTQTEAGMIGKDDSI